MHTYDMQIFAIWPDYDYVYPRFSSHSRKARRHWQLHHFLYCYQGTLIWHLNMPREANVWHIMCPFSLVSANCGSQDMERNLRRDVIHLWYHSWPDKGVPPTAKTVDFLLKSRKFTKEPTPVVVHCRYWFWFTFSQLLFSRLLKFMFS